MRHTFGWTSAALTTYNAAPSVLNLSGLYSEVRKGSGFDVPSFKEQSKAIPRES